MKTLITPTSIEVDAVPKKEKISNENIPDFHSNLSKNDTNPLVDYNSDSDSSDPENPSCMAFCYGFRQQTALTKTVKFKGSTDL